jgi:hypothetical protein
MFHMSNASHMFRTREQLEGEGWELQGNIFNRKDERYLPLYEAKVIHQFTHRYGDYRRLTYMMMDRDVVVVSPSSVFRVLSGWPDARAQ